MVGPEFFDAFVYDAGMLPGMQAVVVARPDGAGVVPLEARQESLDLETRLAAGIGASTEACVWFFPVGQPNYVRPLGQWSITGEDGVVWVVWDHEITINTRGDAVVCTRKRT